MSEVDLQISDLQETIELLNLDKEQLALDKELLEEQLKQTQDELDQYLKNASSKSGNTAQLSSLQEENEKLKDSLLRMNEAIGKEKQTNERLNTQLTSYEKELQELKAYKTETIVTIDELKQSIDSMSSFESMIEKLSTENMELSVKLTEAKESIRELEDTAEVMEEIDVQQRQQVDESRRQLDHLQIERNSMERFLQEKTDANQELTKRLEVMTQNYYRERHQREVLQQEKLKETMENSKIEEKLQYAAIMKRQRDEYHQLLLQSHYQTFLEHQQRLRYQVSYTRMDFLYGGTSYWSEERKSLTIECVYFTAVSFTMECGQVTSKMYREYLVPLVQILGEGDLQHLPSLLTVLMSKITSGYLLILALLTLLIQLSFQYILGSNNGQDQEQQQKQHVQVIEQLQSIKESVEELMTVYIEKVMPLLMLLLDQTTPQQLGLQGEEVEESSSSGEQRMSVIRQQMEQSSVEYLSLPSVITSVQQRLEKIQQGCISLYCTSTRGGGSAAGDDSDNTMKIRDVIEKIHTVDIASAAGGSSQQQQQMQVQLEEEGLLVSMMAMLDLILFSNSNNNSNSSNVDEIEVIKMMQKEVEGLCKLHHNNHNNNNHHNNSNNHANNSANSSEYLTCLSTCFTALLQTFFIQDDCTLQLLPLQPAAADDATTTAKALMKKMVMKLRSWNTTISSLQQPALVADSSVTVTASSSVTTSTTGLPYTFRYYPPSFLLTATAVMFPTPSSTFISTAITTFKQNEFQKMISSQSDLLLDRYWQLLLQATTDTTNNSASYSPAFNNSLIIAGNSSSTYANQVVVWKDRVSQARSIISQRLNTASSASNDSPTKLTTSATTAKNQLARQQQLDQVAADQQQQQEDCLQRQAAIVQSLTLRNEELQSLLDKYQTNNALTSPSAASAGSHRKLQEEITALEEALAVVEKQYQETMKENKLLKATANLSSTTNTSTTGTAANPALSSAATAISQSAAVNKSYVAVTASKKKAAAQGNALDLFEQTKQALIAGTLGTPSTTAATTASTVATSATSAQAAVAMLEQQQLYLVEQLTCWKKLTFKRLTASLLPLPVPTTITTAGSEGGQKKQSKDKNKKIITIGGSGGDSDSNSLAASSRVEIYAQDDGNDDDDDDDDKQGTLQATYYQLRLLRVQLAPRIHQIKSLSAKQQPAWRQQQQTLAASGRSGMKMKPQTTFGQLLYRIHRTTAITAPSVITSRSSSSSQQE